MNGMPEGDALIRTMTSPAKSSTLGFLVKVSRPGLWATSAWFYLLPLGRRDVFHSPNFWLGLLYVTLPLGFIIYGWNDLVDEETDRLNPRKGTFLFGARGTRQQLASMPVRIALLQAVFLAAFWYLDGARMVLWFAGLIAFTALYNWPRYGLKSHPPFEVMNQAGFLLVFVLSSWLNHAPQLRWTAMLFGAMFAMHSHVFGEIMDIEPDRLSGRPTTATIIGAVPAKYVIMAFLAMESLLVYIFFKDFWMAGFLAFGAFWFLLDATVLWKDRLYSTMQMRAFLLGWNFIALASMGWVWSTASLTH
jgi:4-hydroxybenzoate polyprenyltransferase